MPEKMAKQIAFEVKQGKKRVTSIVHWLVLDGYGDNPLPYPLNDLTRELRERGKRWREWREIRGGSLLHHVEHYDGGE